MKAFQCELQVAFTASTPYLLLRLSAPPLKIEYSQDNCAKAVLPLVPLKT